MEKQDLINLKKKIAKLSDKEKTLRDLYLRQIATGEIQGPQTGYASIDKTFLKWYSKEIIEEDLPKGKLYDIVYENNKDNLDSIAFEYMGKEITYKELFENVEKASKALKENNVKEDDIVTLAMLSQPEAIYMVLALNKIGAVSYMIDPRTKAKEISKYFKNNKCSFIFTTDLFSKKFKKVIKKDKSKTLISVSLFSSFFPKKNKKSIIKHKSTWNKFIASGIDYEGETYTPYKENVLRMVVHSGGTTGFPKGVKMSDENLLASVYQGINSGIKFERGETWLGIMPLFIIYGASTGTFLPLCLGMKIYLEPLFNPKKLAKILKNKKPNHMTLAPSHFEHLVDNPLLENEDLSYIIAPTVGGDSMKESLEEKTNAWLKEHGCKYKVCKGYGSSETCSGASITISNECNKNKSVGVPLPKTVISIFDPETVEEKISGEYGEICVKGPSNMMGYFGDSKNTKSVLNQHEDNESWVHTGDWGYIDEDGMLYITDRIKRMIIEYSGFKILPSYVEQVIMDSGIIKNCVVVGVPDKTHSQGEIPVACIVYNNPQEKEMELAKLKKYLLENLKDDISFPAYFVEFEEIPIITTNGKIDFNTARNNAIEKLEYEGLTKSLKKGIKLY